MKDKVNEDINGNIEHLETHDTVPETLKPNGNGITNRKMQKKMTRKESLKGETDEPIRVEFEDISAAAYRIKNGIRKTKCEKSHSISDLLGMEVFFKKDYMQVTGSFKERGARNTLLTLSKEQQKLGVIAASAGNHALALAYHGRELNIPVTVCMPINAPLTKVSQCRKFGAKIHSIGADIIEARDFALKIAEKEKLQYINGYDHPQILAGQGTCGLEIYEQVKDIDAVVIPVGGAGLLAGCAVALKTLDPNIKIIGVESEKCASFKAAMDAGGPIKIQANQSLTLADGLCVAKVGANAFETSRHYIDEIIEVSESYIAMSVLRLVECEKSVVEGAGATGLAAAFAGKLDHLKGKRVVFPLCGGNIDSTVLGRVIERGLAADGRLIRFSVIISDRPGGLAELTGFLAKLGVSVKDILHERAWLKTSVFMTENHVVCEVRDHEHAEELKRGLEKEKNFTLSKWLSTSIENHEV